LAGSSFLFGVFGCAGGAVGACVFAVFAMQQKKPRIAVIACSVLKEEVECFARGLPHVVMIEYLPQLLHNEPARLRGERVERLKRQPHGAARRVSQGRNPRPYIIFRSAATRTASTRLLTRSFS